MGRRTGVREEARMLLHKEHQDALRQLGTFVDALADRRHELLGRIQDLEILVPALPALALQ